MYIWVILAMFMAMMFSFNLHHRADVVELVETPLAEGVAIKVYNQQKTALDLLLRKPDFVFSESANNFVDIKASDLGPYARYGTVFDETNVVTRAYCFDKNDNRIALTCSDPRSSAYVLTFMRVPTRWVNPQTWVPNKELAQAIRNVGGISTSYGYTLDFDLGDTEVKIQNTDTATTFVPAVAISNTQEPSYASLCLQGQSCVVYVTVKRRSL